ncbi:type II secretion system F family protein [Massilia sp. P8910]|uniref:type II secretion system F family protein n=1 Tax=Massilia antarctica TaxID=2765360 RepID=UPI001E535481|nr:type II secretion system F family protein [Massilia antarctica]MCE3603613.1 type II secretion system F family protein [Massilia antarctica]
MHINLKVFAASDGVTLLRIEAPSIEEARQKAVAQGFQVISARRSWGRLAPRTPLFSVPLFTQETVSLLDAGLSLVETIDILTRKSKHTDSRTILQSISRHLQEGLSFSRALEELPKVFPVLYIATVRTSERTGNLTEALKRFLLYHRQLTTVREKVVAAAIYPALLLAVGFIVILFLLGYVVPRFSLVYQDLGKNLPWMSRALMAWGQFISQYGWQVLTGLIAAIAGLCYVATRPLLMAHFLEQLWSIPAVGEKLRLYQLARFTRTLAMLVKGGIPFVTALDMVRDLLKQPALQSGLIRAASAIREGRTVSEAFSANALATEVGARLIIVGERSGELGQAMERIATLYDDEISSWVDWFTKLFEPILMIIIGVVIGAIVVLMYLPIFELANSLQ